MSLVSVAPPASASPSPAAADDVLQRELRGWRAVLGVCFVATLALSWRLWVPSARDYPLVPVIDGLPQPPFPLDWLLLAAAAGAMLGMSFARRPRPYAIVLLAIFSLWLVLDQTRWQAYIPTYLAGTACVLLGESAAVRAPGDPSARWHVAPFQLSLCAVYLYSGLHKLNVRFLETTYLDWTRPITRRLGLDLAAHPGVMLWSGVAVAVGEAVLGLALLWPRTRRPAVVGLTVMHLYIVRMLAEDGAAGNTVVWPWNVAMVATLWLLFWPRAAGARLDGFIRAWWGGVRGRRGAVPRPLGAVWVAVLVFFGVLPALSWGQMWDASLSSQLYAAKHRYVSIHVGPGHRAALPPAFVRAEQPAGEVNLIRWALGEMNVAPIMETRVVTRIGRSLARQAPDAEVRVVIAGPPHVLTGQREYRTFIYSGPAAVPREVESVVNGPRFQPARIPGTAENAGDFRGEAPR